MGIYLYVSEGGANKVGHVVGFRLGGSVVATGIDLDAVAIGADAMGGSALIIP